MSEDLDDIDYLIEAPYKQKDVKKEESSLPNGHGTNGKALNGDQQTPMDVVNEDSSATRDKADGEKSSETEKKEKKKDRSRSRDRKKKHKDRSRSRSRSKSKKSKRSRSRSGSRRHRSKSRDRKRSRSRSRDRKRRTRSRSRSHHRRSSRSRSRERAKHRSPRPSPKRREPSPELTPEERDFRTVFCMQLAARIRPRDLEEFFSSVGKVRDVRLITDPRTKRSKGIAYIEFRDLESVPLAIALTGQRLLGVPIIVKLTQAEKNRNALPPITLQSTPLPSAGPMKLYVGSLHVNISEEMLRGIFEPFGKIDQIQLSKDDMNRSKGSGFITFFNADDAKRAMDQLNGFDLAGRPMKVTPFNEKNAPDSAMGVLDNDDYDRAGFNLGPSGKLALMAKLAEGTGMSLPKHAIDMLTHKEHRGGGPSTSNEASGDSSPSKTVESPCFLLSNMFDLEEEMQNGPDWASDLESDVVEECSKYGGVVHISVDDKSTEGNVYVKCSTIAFALAAIAALNGRYFAGRQIRACFVPLNDYLQRFPEAAHAHRILKPSSS